MTEDNSQPCSPDRRGYFRIPDEVLLKVLPLTAEAVAAVVERITDRVPDRFTVAANFTVNSRAMARTLHGIAQDAPDAARYMKHLDHKLNHLARLFVLEEVEQGAYPRLDVCLSAGGLVFPAEAAYAPDELLEMRMVVYPQMIGVLTVARVVRCDPRDPATDGRAWQIAVEYVHIRESDRDLLCSHIIARETELLRRQRGEPEA